MAAAAANRMQASASLQFVRPSVRLFHRSFVRSPACFVAADLISASCGSRVVTITSRGEWPVAATNPTSPRIRLPLPLPLPLLHSSESIWFYLTELVCSQVTVVVAVS